MMQPSPPTTSEALRHALFSQISGRVADSPPTAGGTTSHLPYGVQQGTDLGAIEPELRPAQLPLGAFPLPIWPLFMTPQQGLPSNGVATNPLLSPLVFNALAAAAILRQQQQQQQYAFPLHATLLASPPVGVFAAPQPVIRHIPTLPQRPGVGKDSSVHSPQAFPLTPTRRAPRRKRARILQDGQLTMIVYGQQEAVTWARRLALFQSTMRDVLGERRKTFTWSGSVLDSVVGAFLTQNVSDALSSRAYMELAARWPAAQPSDITGDCSGGDKPSRLSDVQDTADWEAVRLAPTEDLAETIKCRGMHRKLSELIQACLSHVRKVNTARLMAEAQQELHRAAAAADDELVEVAEVMVAMLGAVENTFQSNDALKWEKRADPTASTLTGTSTAGTSSAGGAASGSGDAAQMATAVVCEGDPPKSPRRRIPVVLAYDDEDVVIQQGINQDSNDAETSLEELYERLQPDASASLLSLEWLRDTPDDDARDFLMSINGLGRKSVACIMLLTLGKREFPVDTNVGRICSRLGWLPLDTSAAIEDLDDYAPEPEVHAFLRSRLHSFNFETLYELHYQMITLGKVFCSKAQPNCRACPMQDNCEYALNNGPSLHGRKHASRAAAADAAAGVSGYQVQTSPFDVETTTPIQHSITSTQYSTPKTGGSVGIGPRVHWRTLQKQQRVEEELLRHERLHSKLSPEGLVAAAPKRPRTQGLRRPQGTEDDENAVVKRACVELSYQARAVEAHRQRTAANSADAVPWVPIRLMRRTADEHPSVWDRLPSNEESAESAVGVDSSVWLATEAAALLQQQQSQVVAAVVGDIEDAIDDASTTVSIWDKSHLPFSQLTAPVEEVLEGIEDLAGGEPTENAETVLLATDMDIDIIAEADVEAMAMFLGEEMLPRVPAPVPLLVSKPIGEQHTPDGVLPATTSTGTDGAATDASGSDALVNQDLQQTASVEDIDMQQNAEDSIDIMTVFENTSAAELSALPPTENNKEDAAAAATTATPLDVNKPQSQPEINPVVECERLCKLGDELSALSEAILLLPSEEEIELHTQRLLEVSLEVLGVDSTMNTKAAADIVTAGRRRYHAIARALHPDRCKIDGASDAFAAAGRSMAVVLEHARALEAGNNRDNNYSVDGGDDYEDCDLDAAPFVDHSGTALGPLCDGTELLKQIVWNSSRLVVRALVVPPELHDRFPLQAASYDTTCSGDEHLLFLPLDVIPTLQDPSRRMVGNSTVAVDVAAPEPSPPSLVSSASLRINPSFDTVEAVVEDMLCAVVSAVDGNPHADDDAAETSAGDDDCREQVQGVLLVSCRAALHGRFPLNGTYFQTNEVFVDHVTVQQPVSLPRSVLLDLKGCAVYFGLGIHFMSKAMTRQDVAHMFASGWCCFRSIVPKTKSPQPLPHFLMPSIPTKSNTPWKNADERRAAAATKAENRFRQNLNNVSNRNAGFNLSAGYSTLGFMQPQMRLPTSPAAGAGSSLHGSPRFGPGGSLPQTPVAARDTTGSDLYGRNQPKSQAAADARSGKGRTRVNRFPFIKGTNKCGTCKSCLNPGWKKACEVRRSEMLALAAAAGASAPVQASWVDTDVG